jgi:hypothetical protein
MKHLSAFLMIILFANFTNAQQSDQYKDLWSNGLATKSWTFS